MRGPWMISAMWREPHIFQVAYFAVDRGMQAQPNYSYREFWF